LTQINEITRIVKQAAREAGFELAGISPVRDFAELDYLPEWIDSGKAGEMHYMGSREENGQLKRQSLRSVAPWARSVIVCAMNYNTAQPYSTQLNDPSRGWISRYAWGAADYHKSVLARLKQIEQVLRTTVSTSSSAASAAVCNSLETRCYVDTGPIVERVYAKYAGVGWIGKNTCVLNQKLGSWLFLGVILTSVELEADMPAPDRCGTCTRCIEACPTEAFVAPYQLDASRCISYLTIEKRGAIPDDLRAGMGRHVFGCDICQDVCPWNRKAPATVAPEFQPRPELINPALDWLAQMSTEEFAEQFRGSPVRRAKRNGLRRNAIIAMGNSGDATFEPLLSQLVDDDDPAVSDAAKWAWRQIIKPTEAVADCFPQGRPDS
jgi:epoxyqueuosine reductase